MVKKSGQRYSILAVDDNRNALEIIRRILNQSGYQVITCKNVQDAVNLLNGHHFDLVITDMKMPRHSGFELVRHVSENFYDTAVIMVTRLSGPSRVRSRPLRSAQMTSWPSLIPTMN